MTSTDNSTFDQAYYQDYTSLSWAEHWICQLDGQAGRVVRKAQFRFLPPHDGHMVFAWGLAKMDNGEIVVAGACPAIPGRLRHTVLAFSKDLGATWSDYHVVEGISSRRASDVRPQMLVYLGNGELSFMTSWATDGPERWYSKDYGRTWPERVKLDRAPDNQDIQCEGNSLVDRDKKGIAVRIAETGQTESNGPFPNTLSGCIRWSCDGGRSREHFDWPKQWKWQDAYNGKTYDRGVGEGALVRAANGWIVAALRTDNPVRFWPLHSDTFEGTAVSISKDEGKSWSPLHFVFGPGRHHANLLRLANGNLVMTVIRRLDLNNDKLQSYRRGCDAVISHDNGQTWEVDRMYILDEFSAIGTDVDHRHKWRRTLCGHVFSIALDDGRILTTYGNYNHVSTLILWEL